MNDWSPPQLTNGPLLPPDDTDEERWIEALTVERHYGEGALQHVNGRVMDCEAAGNNWGASRWRDIRLRLEALYHAAQIRQG